MANEDGKQARAVLLLFATALLWSFGGVLIKCIDWRGMWGNCLALLSGVAFAMMTLLLRQA